MSEFKKDDWVKLDADCNDRKAGLINGDVGQVSGFYGGYPIIDFGGANPGRVMLSQRLALISPAEAASVGDTVIIGADVRDALDNLETEMRKQNELERGR